MSKKLKVIIGMIVILILLVPIPFKLKDGGTIEWQSLIYKISIVHKLNTDSIKGYEDGTIVEILGCKIYDNVSYNKITNTENDNMKATIEAIVVKVNENNLLAMGIENGNELYSIGLKSFKNIEFKKGQKILIYFSGDIMESYPAQFSNIGKIEIIDEKSNIEIPDYILRYCYSFKDNIQVTINELTNSGITLTITDTNELPYQYAHSYKINKEVKNDDYTGIGHKTGQNTYNTTSGYTRNRN